MTDQQLIINKLEKQNDSISNTIVEVVKQNENNTAEINTLKHIIEDVNDYPSPEIIITGIPIELAAEPHMVINNILQKLDAPQLISDVLETRQITNKKSSVSTTSNDQQMKLSYIVQFKSVPVARFVINQKRKKGVLTVKHVFDCDLSGNVYVNEFLNSRLHELFRKVKESSKVHKFKYVWVKDGKIFVRKSDNTDVINIKTENDLREVESTI